MSVLKADVQKCTVGSNPTLPVQNYRLLYKVGLPNKSTIQEGGNKMDNTIFTDAKDHIIKTSPMIDEHQLIKITEKTPEVKNIGKIVRGDTNSNILTFEINRYYDNVDLYDKNIKFIVKNELGIFTENAVNLQYNDELLRFSWILSESVTYKSGTVTAAIIFIGIESDEKYALKTIPFTITIENSLDYLDMEPPYRNWFLDIENMIYNLENSSGSSDVSSNHSHENQSVLDKLSVSNEGDLLYDGKKIQSSTDIPLSAYDIAVNNGFTGTEAEWLESLKGKKGDSAGFGTPTATVDLNTGTPSVTVTSSGSNTAKVFNFAFKNLKGAKGDAGTRGSMFYWGTAITGTSSTATVFSGSGISNALVNDLYINTSNWNIYQCTTAGAPSSAKWIYKGNIKGEPGNSSNPEDYVILSSKDEIASNSEPGKLVDALTIKEVFQSVSNGKQLIASAITDKGINTDAEDTFETMAGNIGEIALGGGNNGSISSPYVFSFSGSIPLTTDRHSFLIPFPITKLERLIIKRLKFYGHKFTTSNRISAAFRIKGIKSGSETETNIKEYSLSFSASDTGLKTVADITDMEIDLSEWESVTCVEFYEFAYNGTVTTGDATITFNAELFF